MRFRSFWLGSRSLWTLVSLSNFSLAQFSNQGIFGDLLQALPRINQTNPHPLAFH